MVVMRSVFGAQGSNIQLSMGLNQEDLLYAEKVLLQRTGGSLFMSTWLHDIAFVKDHNLYTIRNSFFSFIIRF